jgi:glycine betaine/proline transport system substrate-binding protein
VQDVVDWLQTHLNWLFDLISSVLNGMYHGVDAVLGGGQPLIMAGIFAVVAFWLRGLLPGVLAFAGFALIDSLALWDDAMATLSLVVVAAVITVAVAVPLGIWAARNSKVSATVRPVLDVMQTMPAFVYLIPGVMFFGVGTTPGIIATIVFAMPPGVRMTELGIRQVDEELVEAAAAFGTAPRATLTRVQLPLALPTIMAGINQVIMLALSMVVIGGMAGAGGLGEQVYAAITQLQVGLAAESGVAVVVLAMYLDRMTGALNERVSPLGRRAAAKAATAVRRLKLARYKPHTAVAVVGVLVLALAAGGLNYVDSGHSDGTQATGKVGAGKTINMGYIPWDEGIATSYLWKNLLQQRGYTVNLKQLDVGPLYSGIARGDIDFQTDAWLPTTHKAYWDKYHTQLEDLGDWYSPTSLELTVPAFVKNVNSLADLKGHASEFGGKIIGIEASAGEMATLKNKVLKAYGLQGEYQVVSSSTSSMLAQLERSIKKRQPIVVPLWSPHWVYGKYDLKKLKDPKGAWGKGEQIHTIAHKGFSKKDPTVAGWLKKFHLSEDQLTSLENAIQDAGQGNEPDGVKAWLKKNPGMVDKLAPVPGGAIQKGKDAGKTVNMGYFPWDEAIASTALWEDILKDRGYKTNVQQLDPGPLYTAVAKGDIDFQTDAWLPTTHKAYWDRFKKNLVDVGSWYSPTSLELTVPAYVKNVNSLADLKGHASEFGGKIIGIEASAGEMATLKNKVLKAYGLQGEYQVVSSSTSSMLAQLDQSIKKRQPVVVTLWTPHWAYGKYDLKKLKDPKGAWGKGDALHVVAHKGFAQKFPELDGWLKNFHLSESQLASLEVEVKKGGTGNEKASARRWLNAHPGLEDELAPVAG